LELLPSILQALSAVILTVGLSINEPSNGTSATEDSVDSNELV
jgi:hypothetical protein